MFVFQLDIAAGHQKPEWSQIVFCKGRKHELSSLFVLLLLKVSDSVSKLTLTMKS